MDSGYVPSVNDPNRSVCFSGHRRIPGTERKRLKQKLRLLVFSAAEKGYTDFYCGGALGFDTLAAEAVIIVRETVPAIRLHVVIPCRNQAGRWAAADQKRYKAITEAADETVVLSENYYPGCMMARNMYMVNHASVCVCYMYTLRGGTWSTVRYAVQKSLFVYNLAIQQDQVGNNLKEGLTWNSMFISPSVKRNAATALFHPTVAKKGIWKRIQRR